MRAPRGDPAEGRDRAPRCRRPDDRSDGTIAMHGPRPLATRPHLAELEGHDLRIPAVARRPGSGRSATVLGRHSGARVRSGRQVIEMLQTLQSIAVIAIPLVGAWLAWQQVEIARVKLRLDLFDKRFAVFDAARRFLLHVFAHGNTTDEALREYTLGTIDAAFLFDDE